MQNWKIRILILLFTFAITQMAFSQQQKIKLLGLAVEGNTYADAGLILANSGLVLGEEVSGEKIQRAIRQLWGLDLFSDIKVIAERITGEGVYLQIQVKEYPRLRDFSISGGKKLGKDDIDKAVGLRSGQVFRPSDPVLIRNNIRKLAEKKGYLLADTRIRIKDGETDFLKIVDVDIVLGSKIRIRSIEFVGNEEFTDRKLRRQLDKTRQRTLFRSGAFNQDQFEEDKKNLIDFYREHGFRDAGVVSDTLWYSSDRKRIHLQIHIEEGFRYYFGDVTFSGQEIFTDEYLKNYLLFAPGEVFNQKKYEISIGERLGSLFYDQGYIYTQIIPQEIPVSEDTLDISIYIDPGNQVAVRQIHIVGNTKTHEKVIRREFDLKPGDTFYVSRLRRSLRNVNILNYFGNIIPDVESINDDEVDLWIKVEEKPTDQANVSAGYSGSDGLIGALGFTAPNLFGTGQRLNLDWNFGARYGSFSISYTEPWLFDTETLVGVSFYSLRRRWVDGFTERVLGGSTRLGRRLGWPDDYFRGDWIYRIDQTKYYDFSESFRARKHPGIIEDRVRISSSITQIITRDSRDFPEFPTTGSTVSLTSQLAGGPLLGDDQYHKHTFSIDWYSAIIKKLVIHNHTQMGFLAGLTGSSDDIPGLDYFYMGGGGLSIGVPLRGYDERTVGPRAATGNMSIGGKAMFKAGTEMRLLFVENPTIYGLVFAEAGNSWLNFDQIDLYNLRRSVGFGVRLYMPLVGMIGLDYGYGLDYFDAAGKRRGVWKPHFQFGRQF